MVLLIMSAPACAQTMTGNVTPTMLRTGWNIDAFAIVTAQPIVNPAGCSQPDGYQSLGTLPGYHTYLATALTAIALDSNIRVTIHNSECAGSRPKIIGINIPK